MKLGDGTGVARLVQARHRRQCGLPGTRQVAVAIQARASAVSGPSITSVNSFECGGQVGQELVARMRMVQLRNRELSATQPARTVQARAVDFILAGECGTQPRPARGGSICSTIICTILGGLIGISRSRPSQPVPHFQRRIVQGQGNRKCPVDAWIREKNHTLSHGCILHQKLYCRCWTARFTAHMLSAAATPLLPGRFAPPR